MHVAPVFVVEAHLNELRADAESNRFPRKAQGPNRIRTFITAAVESFRAFSEPTTPTLASYPFAD
jgi:hypothetical protein